MNLRFRIFKLFKSRIRKNQLQFQLEISSTFWVYIHFLEQYRNIIRNINFISKKTTISLKKLSLIFAC